MITRWYKKTIVICVIVLFLCSSALPIVGSKADSQAVSKIIQDDLLEISGQEMSSLSFYTFDKTGSNQNNLNLPPEKILEISELFEELRSKIVYEPLSEGTKKLKLNFIKLLEENSLIINDDSKNEIASLLTPKYSRISGGLTNIFNGASIFNKFSNSPKLSSLGTSFLCSVSSGGTGAVMPLFMLPRPRIVALWAGSETSVTLASNLLTGRGFVASGHQSGMLLGFLGVGLTYSVPGATFYGFIGYSLFAGASADIVEFFPPNMPPVISDEVPENGKQEVSVSTSELSFRLSDPDGDRMTYRVTTDPDVGSDQGSGKNGIYSIPISGLEADKEIKWTVEVDDGKNFVEKEFTFVTEGRPPFDPFDEGWKYRKKITIDHAYVDDDFTDFTVLISTIDSDLRDKAQDDGDDILFMDDTGVATKAYHEIEEYQGSSGKLIAWVKVPILSSSFDTDLYMYYGNSGSSSEQLAKKSWDSDYIHIWHMGDSLVDSIGLNDGTNQGTNIVSGRVGKARDFELDENDYIVLGDMAQPADGSLTTMTWESWFKPETLDLILMCKYDSSGTDYSSYLLDFIQGGKLRIEAGSSWGVGTHGITDESYEVMGQWMHLTATYNLGGINEIDAFINGTEVPVSQPMNSANVMWDTQVTDDIGRCRFETWTEYTDGLIDEIRWSKIVRSDAWIKTSYNTMNDPSSFLNIGLEENPP